MISNCSFLKVLKENAKRRIWLFILSAYLYLTYLIDFMLAQSGQSFFRGDKRLGPGNSTVFMITVLLAVVCAFQGFSYLFSEEKTDFYFCLPIKRNRLFFAGYLNGVLLALVPCIFSRLICYFIEGSRTSDALYVTWMGILMNILGFLLIYNLVLCIILLTGHILIAAAGTVMLFFYGTFAFGIVIGKYSSAFFHTYYRINIMDKLAVFTSPYKLYGALCGTDGTQDIGDWLFAPHLREFIITSAVLILAFLLAYQLYKHRPAEACGRALTFEKAKLSVKFLLALPATLIIGYYVMLCSPGGRSFVLLAIGLIFGAFTIHGLLEVIFQFDIRGMLSGKKHFFALFIACLLVAGSFYFDVWGYDNYAPKQKEVQSAAVFISGLDDSAYTKQSAKPGAEFNDSNADEQLSDMQLKGADKAHLLTWISKIRRTSKTSEKPLTYTVIAYKLSGGRIVYRKYPLFSAKQLEDFQSIYGSSAYKKGAFPSINHKSPGVRHYVWSNGVESFHLDLTDKENEYLMELIKADFMKLTLNDLKQELPIGTLTLVYGTNDLGESAPLYPSFFKTLQYLEGLGIPTHKTISDYKVTQVSLYKKRVDISAFGKVTKTKVLVKDTTDAEEIKTLTQAMIPAGYAFNQLLHPVNTTYEATVSWKNSAGRTIQFAQMNYIPEK